MKAAHKFRLAALALLALLIPARADLAILPLGDSITYGAHGLTGGYRYPLYINLTQAGIGFHYLGQSDTNCQPLPYPDQWHHDGFPGATIKDLRDNLDGSVQSKAMVVPNLGGYWMTGGKPGGPPVQPDLILLLAGTNNIIHPPAQGGTDVAGMESQFTDLVGWLTKNRPDAIILIGTVTPIPRQPASWNAQVVAFNAWLKANVSSFGPKCHLADLYSAFVQPDGTPSAKLLGDSVHPTDAGYAVMGKVWSDAIVALVNGGALKKEAPAAPGNSFALPTDRQSPIPTANNTRAEPATVSAGASLVITTTITAGNNALTAPIAYVSIRDAKGNPLPNAKPASATLANLAPHAGAPVQATLTVPTGLAPGAYDIAVDAKAKEGFAHAGFAAKITVAGPRPSP
jgi:hypothetical protein